MSKSSATKIFLAAAAVVGVAVLGGASSVQALGAHEHLTDGDSTQYAGLRLLGQDGVNNLGLGAVLGVKDEDSSTGGGAVISLEDALKKLAAETGVTHTDENGSGAAGLGIKVDGLTEITTNVDVRLKTDDASGNAHAGFNTSDLDSLLGAVVVDGKTDDASFKSGTYFGFE